MLDKLTKGRGERFVTGLKARMEKEFYRRKQK